MIKKIKNIFKIKNKDKEQNKKYRSIFGIKVEKIENFNLFNQLVIITLTSFAVCIISLLLLVPMILRPFYENNLYNYLKQPASYIRTDNKKDEKNLAYIIITNSGATYTSSNFNDMFKDSSAEEIINISSNDYGKFKYNSKTYYYAWGGNLDNQNLVISNDNMIKSQEKELTAIMFPTMLITIMITTILIFLWSKYILNKIKILKRQAENMTNYKLDDKYYNVPYFIVDDELNSLSQKMTDAKHKLREKEEYKNLMFQNVSHELKTPIAVIKSYIEGVEDKVVEESKAIPVIKEEIDNLSSQVNMLLQISKLDYIKGEKIEKVNIVDIIEQSIETHRKINKELVYKLNINSDKDIIYEGIKDIYKTVCDNILGNFVRYARHEITINVSEDSIQFINDGEKIDEKIIDKIFLPYVKGKSGESGLGLYITERMLDAVGYKIKSENLDNSVMFEISKK